MIPQYRRVKKIISINIPSFEILMCRPPAIARGMNHGKKRVIIDKSLIGKTLVEFE